MSVDIWQIDCDGIPYKPYPGRDNSREALAGEQWVLLTDYDALALELAARPGFAEFGQSVVAQAQMITELKEQLTAYQIAKDNLELRLAKAMDAVRGSGIQGSNDGVVILGRGTGPTFYRPAQVY